MVIKFTDQPDKQGRGKERERITSFSQTTSLIGWGGVASPHLHESYTCTYVYTQNTASGVYLSHILLVLLG